MSVHTWVLIGEIAAYIGIAACVILMVCIIASAFNEKDSDDGVVVLPLGIVIPRKLYKKKKDAGKGR